MKLNSTLLDSTTYSFTFRQSIADITEKNSPPNLKIAFSTGNYIDSLSITGTTKDLLTNKPQKDITVAIYLSDTFDIFKHKPIYVTQSDVKGKFTLTNLKPGKYHIYAFSDKNRNLTTDPKTEAYAFLSNPIQLNENIDTITLRLVRLDTRPLKLTSARPYNSYYNIKTTKQLIHYNLAATDRNLIHSFGEDNTIIKLYNTFPDDSLLVRLTAIDSAQNQIDTTVYAKFLTRKSTPEKFTIQQKRTALSLSNASLETQISYSKPIVHINYDSILLKLDSANTLSLTPTDIKIDSINKTLTIIRKINRSHLEPTTTPTTNTKPAAPAHQLYYGYGAFVSIENDSSKAWTENLKLLTPENTGVILIKVQTKTDNFIIQLKDKAFNTLRTAKNIKEIRWDDLPPGDYQIIFINDTNRDGKWSPGNKLKNEEPEEVIYHQNEKKNTTITLKANWELGPLLINYP